MNKIHTGKFVLIFVCVSFILVTGICFFLTKNEKCIKKLVIDEINNKDSSVNIRYCIDTCSITKSQQSSNFVFSGWILKQGVSSNDMSIKIGLSDGKEGVLVPTAMIKRTDVSKYFNDGNNYDNSGFSVNVNIDSSLLKKMKFIHIFYNINNEIGAIKANACLE